MIKILPLDQIISDGSSVEEWYERIEGDGKTSLFNVLGRNFSFYTRGRDAISALIDFLGFDRRDEVYITTTTDSSFVSTCVSATIFNYCRISRVLTEETRAIFVIHSFGFPHPKLFELRKIADRMKIPLIEDCAFAFDSYIGSTRLGSIGDYSIYSLSKIFPLKLGGILEGWEIPFGRENLEGLREEVEKWVPKLWYLKRKRIENYLFLLNHFGEYRSIYGAIDGENPFMFGIRVRTDRNLDWLDQFMDDIEFGATHVPGEIHIPVNPFCDMKKYRNIFHRMKGMISSDE